MWVFYFVLLLISLCLFYVNLVCFLVSLHRECFWWFDITIGCSLLRKQEIYIPFLTKMCFLLSCFHFFFQTWPKNCFFSWPYSNLVVRWCPSHFFQAEKSIFKHKHCWRCPHEELPRPTCIEPLHLVVVLEGKVPLHTSRSEVPIPRGKEKKLTPSRSLW